MSRLIYIYLVLIFTISPSFANEQIYNGLVKRKIKEKIIGVNEVIKKKELDRYLTFSIKIDDQLVYCHYEKIREKSLPLIICY